jgi:CDP-paratose 2-epimerase
MSVAIVTGSNGLIGSEAVRFFATKGLEVVGIDNNMRQYFFGPDASTAWVGQQLANSVPNYHPHDLDIRDHASIGQVFKRFGKRINLVVHTAAQPSHDWAAREPITDFMVNANGTLNLLEATREHAPDATFIFTSTNKVYGDSPNKLPFVETESRWEVACNHKFAARGVTEEMAIDQSMHSLFGASKIAADIMVQEYGRYFHMKTVCFRGGCLTGPNHSGTSLHGFLAYLMKCTVTGTSYKVLGYKGKQVRDNIHSSDLIRAFDMVMEKPRLGEVYNIGGSRFSNCSMLEAIYLCERISGQKLKWEYEEINRIGDHIWWISDISKFQTHYPEYKLEHNVESILTDIYDANHKRWTSSFRPTYA